MSNRKGPDAPANVLFRRELNKKFKESRATQGEFAKRCGLSNAVTVMSFYLSGKRSPGLALAVDIANRVGIDLGKIQREAQ